MQWDGLRILITLCSGALVLCSLYLVGRSILYMLSTPKKSKPPLFIVYKSSATLERSKGKSARLKVKLNSKHAVGEVVLFIALIFSSVVLMSCNYTLKAVEIKKAIDKLETEAPL